MSKRITGLFIALLAFTQKSMACSVCFSAKEETLFAFYFTTGLLTFLPFILVGSIIYLIRKRCKALAEEEASAQTQ